MSITIRGSSRFWWRDAKKALTEAGPEALRGSLKSLGYHSRKRAQIRYHMRRRSDSKTLERLAKTDYRAMLKVYEEIEMADLRAARAELLTRTANSRETRKPHKLVSACGAYAYLDGPEWILNH